jgi:hypothetical protein
VQRHRAVAQPDAQIGGGGKRRLFRQLGPIGGDEIFPARGIVIKAAAQRVAGRDLLEPEVDASWMSRRT